jgi:hypothetical protein
MNESEKNFNLFSDLFMPCLQWPSPHLLSMSDPDLRLLGGRTLNLAVYAQK